MSHFSPSGRVVLCHGVFDWIHHGHLEHLEEAKGMGDVLVVSVVADRFLEKGRVIQDEVWRVKMLEALRIVDQVVLSTDILAPCGLLHTLRPQLYVRGPDYVGQRRPDTEVAERLGIPIAFTKTVLNVSTTKLKSMQMAITPCCN